MWDLQITRGGRRDSLEDLVLSFHCMSPGSNTGLQAWGPEPFPTELSHGPYLFWGVEGTLDPQGACLTVTHFPSLCFSGASPVLSSEPLPPLLFSSTFSSRRKPQSLPLNARMSHYAPDSYFVLWVKCERPRD